MKPQVTVGIPSYGTMSTITVQSLCWLLLSSLDVLHPKATTAFRMLHGSYIDMARNFIARDAADDESVTHLLFIDMDMALMPDSLHRLLAHEKDVVGGWYCDKSDPPVATAWNFADNANTGVIRVQNQKSGIIRITEDMQGLQQVGGVPMGCTLISTSILRKMREHFGDENWFDLSEVGEDVHFSKRLRAMGVPSYLDCNLTCGHVKEAIVTYEYWKHCQAIKKAQKSNGQPVSAG